MAHPNEEHTGRKVTENIYLCPDGKYRWTYELQMLKNPTILITILKVILLSFGIVMAFLILINLIGGRLPLLGPLNLYIFFRNFSHTCTGHSCPAQIRS
ncbi:MAG: hypothetical protein IJV14_16465 [Lachnospiraceae bacterium]|nr:hypothetical protein [Lachnospiraceae bacterium]MBQ9614157.1 hypothetical protein [Lachnospiraceae bacterium]